MRKSNSLILNIKGVGGYLLLYLGIHFFSYYTKDLLCSLHTLH
jgi:hypothetical protein